MNKLSAAGINVLVPSDGKSNASGAIEGYDDQLEKAITFEKSSLMFYVIEERVDAAPISRSHAIRIGFGFVIIF